MGALGAMTPAVTFSSASVGLRTRGEACCRVMLSSCYRASEQAWCPLGGVRCVGMYEGSLASPGGVRGPLSRRRLGNQGAPTTNVQPESQAGPELPEEPGVSRGRQGEDKAGRVTRCRLGGRALPRAGRAGHRSPHRCCRASLLQPTAPTRTWETQPTGDGPLVYRMEAE